MIPKHQAKPLLVTTRYLPEKCSSIYGLKLPMAKKLPNPCLDVCKYELKGHCIACSMTKAQKSLFKQLKKKKHQQAFIDMLMLQQISLGISKAWSRLYLTRCENKKVAPPCGLSGDVSWQQPCKLFVHLPALYTQVLCQQIILLFWNWCGAS